MVETFAPIAVFAYNRADKLDNCIKSLEKCPEAHDSELFIFCDGAKGDKDRDAVDRVRAYARKYVTASDFREASIIEHEKNRGLASSIMSGVTEIVNKYGKVIVIEDDLVLLPSFLKYMNEGLEFYKDDVRYGSICGFSYPMKELEAYNKDMYATRKADCWGWATWANRWNDAVWANTDYESYLRDVKLRWEFEGLEAGIDRLMYLQYKGKINSWAVRWIYYLFKNGQFSVYPTKTVVINDGFDGSGTHISHGFGEGFNSDYSESTTDYRWEKCEIDEKLVKACARFPRRFFPLYVLETARYLMKRS